MAGKALDAGKTFLEDVLKRSKIPADVQAAILADETVLEGVGDGALMRAEATRLTTELNRELTRVKAVADDQLKWHNANDKAVLERTIEDLRAKVATGNPGGIDEKALDTRLTDLSNNLETMGVGLTATMTNIGLSHLKEFGETLDMHDLAQKAIAAKKTLVEYYTGLVGPERKKRADEARATELKAAEERGRVAGRTEALNNRGPYPVGQGQGPSTLDGLRKPDTKVQDDYTLAAAVATAEAEMAKA